MFSEDYGTRAPVIAPWKISVVLTTVYWIIVFSAILIKITQRKLDKEAQNQKWPPDLGMKYPLLLAIPSPRLYHGIPDNLEWRTNLGVVKPFAVSSVWQSIRPRGFKVNWVHVVWYPNCIPRHAFNIWLFVKRKLKTQDRLWSWDVAGSMSSYCSLCETTPDSHEHLFFECPFSSQVWFHLRDLVGLPSIQPSINLIMDAITPTANRCTSNSVISKLVLATVAYFVWQERNERLFKGLKMSFTQVIDCVVSASSVMFPAVLSNLMSCRFKKSIAQIGCS
ncbi:reverse transcriptase domain, reverse transcriptase zinc-binding domain protein [Tanacetum coccineum]